MGTPLTPMSSGVQQEITISPLVNVSSPARLTPLPGGQSSPLLGADMSAARATAMSPILIRIPESSAQTAAAEAVVSVNLAVASVELAEAAEKAIMISDFDTIPRSPTAAMPESITIDGGKPMNLPSTAEIYALGFNPLKLVTITEAGKTTSFVQALSKHGYKVLILLDSPLMFDGNRVVMTRIAPQEPMNIPEQFKQSCRMCTNEHMCGIAYERNGTMCQLSAGVDGTTVKEDLYLQFPGGPGGVSDIFTGDAAPFPIVRLSQLQANPAAVHEMIAHKTRNVIASLLTVELAQLDMVRSKLGEIDEAVAEYKGLLAHKIGELYTSCARMKEIDATYDTATITAENSAAMLMARGKVWNNLTHRQLLWGHLINSAANVARLAQPLGHIHKAIEAEKIVLATKCGNLHAPMEFSYL